MKRNLMLGLAAATSLAFAASAHADPGGVKAGVLTCNVSSGWGLIFGSSKDLHCTFENGSGREDDYVGTINKYGVDIGYHNGGVIVWAVFAPTSDIAPARSAATTAASPPAVRSVLAPAPTRWLAAATGASRCSRSASKA